MKIQVTKEDIEKGEKGSCEWCPVALAIQRTYGKDKIVIVDHSHAEIWDKGTWEEHYQLPQIARDFIHNFDNSDIKSEQLKPFLFKIGKRININERNK